MHKQSTGHLLSHELGHLFGADHDGEIAVHQDSPYFGSTQSLCLTSISQPISGVVPCGGDVHLMSPAVGVEMKRWSHCTKEMVDSFDRLRKREGRDCFFT